jgi:hypothetical protein
MTAFESNNLEGRENQTPTTSPEEIRLAELVTKKKDLKEAIEDLGIVYDKLTNPKTGFSEYKRLAAADKLSEYKTLRDGPKVFKADENTTPKNLLSFVAKRANMLKQKNKLDTARTMFYADSLNDLVNYINLNSEKLDDVVDSVLDVYEKLTQSGTFIYPDKAAKLKEIINSVEDLLNQREQQLLEQAGAEGQSLSDIEEDLVNQQMELGFEGEALPEDLQKLLSDIIELSNLKTKLGNKEQLFEKIDAQVASYDISKPDSAFVEDVLDELIQGPRRILEVAEFQDGVISEFYDDVAAVQKQLDFAKALQEKALSKIEEKPYQQASKSLEEVITDLETVLELTKQNVRNLDIKNKKEDLHYAEAALSFNSYLSENVEVKTLIDSDPVLASMAVMDLVAEEQLSKNIFVALEEEFRKLLNGLDFINNLGDKLSGTPAKYDASIKDEAVKNPLRGIYEIFKIIEKKEPDKTLIEPLIAFNKDYDVIKFKESIKNYKGQVPQQTLLDLLNIHAKFVAINQIRDSENSNFSHVFFLTKIREYLKANPTAPVPSSSQIRVVRELVTFASSPVIQDAEIFENGAALKAPAGAGKSLVVSKLFNYVMGYTAEEIRSAAAFSRAADNIANSLGHPNEAKTIQELTEQLENGTLSEKVKFLIVDEAGPISRTYINAFVRAVNKHNRTAKNKVKYLFLYDPNQPTAGNISRPAIDDGYITDFAGTELDYHQGTPEVQQEYRKGIRFQNPNSDAMRPMALSQNLKQITSLSTTYRSGVSEVVDLQNAYKSAKTVSEVSTASSLDPNVSMTNIFGTFAESGSSIVKKFAESQAANPSRSRVIVVGNQAKAQQYKKALPNADVVVANEVVGITVDEVYVDMTDTDNENFKSPEFFNQWMYAAISRATSYVHLANYPNATHFVDPKVAPAPRKETLNEDAIKTLDEQIKILSEITGVQVTQKQAPSKKDTVKDDSTTDETPDGPGKANTAKDNDGTSKDTTKQPAKEGGKHALQNPGFTVFDADEDNGIQGLLPGDELMVFIDNSPKADGTPAERVVIVRKIVPESGRSFYQLTGVLADKEVEDFEKNVGIDTSRLPKYKLDKTSIYNLYKVDGEVTGHETLYVQPGSEGIKYVYDGKPQEDLADMMDADGNVSAAPLLEKYINEVWGKDTLDDYAEVIKNFHKYVKIVTFKSEAEARKVFKDVEARKLPRPGVPYLIIKDIKLKTGSVAKPQFIQLSTKPVSASSEAYKPLYTFIEKIRKFEELLENSAYLPDVYRTMKLGFPVTQAGEKFFPMHAFIKLLSDAHYDASMDTLSILTEKQKTGFGNLFPDLNRTVMSPELLQLAAEIDELIHGDLNRTRDEKGKIKKDKRDFKGDAQKIFDEIGSQNLVASIDNGEQAGKLLLLRDYKSEYIQNRDGQTKQKPIIKGISLLGNVTFIRKDDKGANNPLMSETLVSRLKLYAASLENRNLTETARYKALTQFLNLVADKSKVPHSNVLTSQDLLDLFVGSKDASGNLTNVSGKFGLKTPSPKNVNYKEDSSILDQPVSDFVSHLSKINKTKLIVAKTRDAIDSVETVKATNARMHSLRVAAGIETLSANDIRDAFDAEVIAEFVSKLKKNTLEEALALFRENAKQKFYYTTNSNKILQAILSRLNRQQVTKEYVRQDLLDSLDVLENYLENKVASRDFLRASVLMRILGVKAAEAKDVFPLLDFVRTNYFSPEQRDEFGFSVDFMGLMNTYETDISTIIPRVNEIIEAYREIAAEYGIEYNVRPIDPNAPLDIVYQMIEDGLIFSLLEGSFTIDGQYIRGITSLGIEIRRKHRANEINLEQAFNATVATVAVTSTTDVKEKQTLVDVIESSSAQAEVPLVSVETPTFIPSKDKPIEEASILTILTLNGVQDSISRQVKNAKGLFSIQERTIVNSTSRVFEIKFNFVTERFGRNPDIYIDRALLNGEVMNVVDKAIKNPDEINKIEPALLLINADGSLSVLSPFGVKGKKAKTDPKSDAFKQVIFAARDFVALGKTLTETLLRDYPDVFWRLQSSKGVDETLENFVLRLAASYDTTKITLPENNDTVNTAVNSVTNFADKLLTWINNNPNADSADVIAQAYDIDDTLGDEFVNNYDPNTSWSEFLKDVIARGTIERSKTFLSEDASKPLSMQEVQDLTDRYTPKNFFTTLREALFGKGPRELIKIVEYGQLVNNQGKQVWGLYKNGVMHFAKLASGGVSSKVVRHELFHKIFWEYLTPSEQIAALSLAREKYGNLSAEALEEALAEEFEDFVVTKRQSFLSRLWGKLKRLLGFSYNNMKSIEEFFNLIENKAFYRQVNGFEGVERSSTNIRTVFNDYAEFRIVKDLILEHVVKNQVERRKAEKDATLPVKSFSELTVDAMAYLEEVAKMDSSKFPDGYTPDQINTIKRAVNKALNNKNFLKNFNDDYFSDTNNRADFVEFLKGLRDRRLEEIRILKEDISKRLEEGEEVSQDEIDALESGDDSTGISDEVLDSMLVDPKTKLTGSIKQRLISIEYYVGSIKHYADLATAFTLIVPKVASIPKGNLREALEALKTTFGNPSIKSRPNIKQAVTNHMANVATDLLAKMDDPTMPKNIAFRKDASHKFLYAIVDTQGGDATLVTRNDLESNPERYREFVIEAGSQVDSIINEISEITNTPKTNVAKVYYFYEDMDFVKSLLASVGSLRKSKPFVWQKSFKFVFRMSGYVVRTSGGKRTFTANVEFAFNKYVAEAVSELRETLFSQELKDGIAKAKTTRDLADKRKAIMVFLKDIGVTKKLTEASTRSIELVFERISQSLDTIQNNYSTALQKKRTLTNAENEDELTGSALLEDEKGLLDEIADMINSHYTLAESGSYTRGDGKKAYGWIDASWQTDIFNIFQRIREGLPFKKVSIFDVKGTTVTTNDIFLKDNIFFNKQNEIFETVDHDSVKWKDGSKFAKTLRKESLKEFRERNIAGNFFVTLATKAGKYYQTLPIPSNRTSVQSVLVNGLVDQRSIDDALKTIIKAQKNRPNPDAKNPDGSLAHPELNNSKTYRERWKEFTFAGLNGNVDSMTESQAIRAIKEHVSEMVSGKEGLFEAFKESLGVAPEVQIPTWAVIKVANILRIKAPLKWDSQWSDEQKNQFFKDKNAAVEAALKVFYFNYIINQYSLSQIAYGDEAFYKSKEDQTKRIQIATATGDTLLVDERFGIPKNSRVLVVEDLKRIVDPTLHDMLASSYDQEYEASDAEGFMLPEFYEKLASAYGFDANTDVVLKPVYFSIEKGIPTAIKYSVKVLTPQLIERYPHLASYAEAMRAKGVDQMVFASAVKIGSPAVKAKLDDSGRIIASSLDEKAIVNINNENLRFQLNPAKNVDASVANKSQGTAMMNTNGKNTSEAFEMHKANAFVIENGLRTLSRQLRLTRKGGVTKGTETKIRKMLTSVLDGLPGGRDVFEMLSLGSGRNKVSLDMPLIGDRVLSTLSSIFTKATTGFRFPGSKLVLQADLGPVEIDGVMRNLKWRDENGFCEVILPETYRPYMEQIKDGIIGFRIPTSNYHSLVPLKVVGFYPVPPGSKGNVIIAPSLIVYYHGSDYDIDTLFVARKDYPNETINLNDFLREIDSEHQDSDNYIIEGGQPYGYKDNVPVDVNGYKLYEALDKYIITVNKQLESFTKQLQNASENQKVALEEAIKTKELVLEKISFIAEAAAKNFIVHNFSTNMRDMKNRKDLLTPISFDKIITLRSELKKELSEKLDDDKFLQTLEESGLIKQICQ